MLALEGRGNRLVVGSLNPPPDSFRHGRLRGLAAQVLYPPPPPVLKGMPGRDTAGWAELAPLVDAHRAGYGESFKPETRALNALYFAHRFRQLGVRHIHVHFANRATHTALFLKKLGFPFSITAHAKDFLVDLGSPELLAEMCAEAEFVVAVSDFSRGLLQEMCPASADKVVRVYNGIDPGEFAAPRNQTPGAPFRILSVGRLIEFKGFHHLIAACGDLRERGVDVELDIVGEGLWSGRLREEVTARGLEGIVRLLGNREREEIAGLLAESDAFALACTTDAEGGTDILPTVIIEAMAAGLPVVSTRLAGVPEMVVAGETGLLVEPGDVPALGDAIAQLANDRPLTSRLGEAGRQLCTEKFSQEVTAPQIESLFRKAGALEVADTHPTHVAYLADHWPADPDDTTLVEEITCACATPEITVLAGLYKEGSDPCETLDAVSFLPDGTVLESHWRSATARYREIDSLRLQVGGAVPGEIFYQQARRALYTVDLLEKRGVRHVHAARSSSLLWAWLVAKLGSFRASYTAERQPVLPRSLIARLSDDFALASVADDRLHEHLDGRFVDELGTGENGGKNHKKSLLAPFRTKAILSADKPPGRDYAGWFRKLIAKP